MRLIPAGEFIMGSDNYSAEKPVQKIYLDAYFIDKHLITNGQFKKFVEETKYQTDAEKEGAGMVRIGRRWKKVSGATWKRPDGVTSIEGKDDYPVSQVSYNDALKYCQWAGKDLPTEAQWEKAARGPEGNEFPWGTSEPDTTTANFDNIVGETSPVKEYEKGQSHYGAFDMAGNVYQWCKDWYAEGERDPENPAGPENGEEKARMNTEFDLLIIGGGMVGASLAQALKGSGLRIGLVEAVPLFYIKNTIEKVSGVRPYTPLELLGRDIYVREGCYLCHSQMIRPLRDEVERYGHYSLAAESMYDHPFQWGSERQGPDLARVGGKYSDQWQRDHLRNPRSVVPGSIMPYYGFLEKTDLNYKHVAQRLEVQAIEGVPYTKQDIADAMHDVRTQATDNAPDAAALQKRYPNANVRDFDGNPNRITEADALIAYLQMLGTEVNFKLYDDKANIR